MQPEYVIMVIVAAALGGSFLLAKRLRYNKFLRKYDDSTIVKKILKNQYWEGQTEAQLIDSLGKPQDKDEKTF